MENNITATLGLGRAAAAFPTRPTSGAPHLT